MRIPIVLSGTLLTLGLLAASPSHAASEPGKISLRGCLGFTTLSLRDINDDIRSVREGFMADTLVEEARWDPFGSSPNLGLELEVQLTKKLSAGLAFSAQKGSRRQQALRVFSTDPSTGEPAASESFEAEPSFSAWDVSGTLGLWVPSAPGLNFGVQLGIVRGTLRAEGTHLYDAAITSLPYLQLIHGEWKGTGAVVGAFTGYEQPLSPELTFSSRLGYRYRRIAGLDGTLATTEWGDQGNQREWTSGPPLDAQGRPMRLDLGGFYVNIGLSLGFGGAD